MSECANYILNGNDYQYEMNAPLNDAGEELIAGHSFDYDTHVSAVGSVINSFAIPGVESHCLFLDNARQALRFQKRLVETFTRIYTHDLLKMRGYRRRLSAYKMPQISVHGYFKTAMLTLAAQLRKTATTHIKLH
ncbi:MAG: hypothetical protein ACRERU_19815 [Methylococcales bacterium]